MKFICYLAISKIQVYLGEEGYVLIWPGVTAPDRHEKKNHKILVSANNKFLCSDFFEMYLVLDHQQKTSWLWVITICFVHNLWGRLFLHGVLFLNVHFLFQRRIVYCLTAILCSRPKVSPHLVCSGETVISHMSPLASHRASLSQALYQTPQPIKSVLVRYSRHSSLSCRWKTAIFINSRQEINWRCSQCHWQFLLCLRQVWVELMLEYNAPPHVYLLLVRKLKSKDFTFSLWISRHRTHHQIQ